MDKIDNIIENVMQKKIHETIEYEQAILNAFEKKKTYNKYSNIIVKIISGITAFFTIIAGIVFAKDISNWVYNIFNPTTIGKGVVEPDFQERGTHDYRKDACLTLREFEQIIIHFKAIFRRFTGGIAVAPLPWRDQPGLASKGCARRCRRLRFAQ